MIRTPSPETKLSNQLETLRVSMPFTNVMVYDKYMVYNFKNISEFKLLRTELFINKKIAELNLPLEAIASKITNTILVKSKYAV